MTPTNRWMARARKVLAGLIVAETRMTPRQVQEVGALLGDAGKFRQFQRSSRAVVRRAKK